MNGNKIKRVLAVLICAFMFIQSAAIGALAAEIDPAAEVYVRPEVVEMTPNQVGTNYVYVDVTTVNSMNDQTIMAYVLDEDGDVLTISYAIVGNDKAEIKLGLPDETESGTYTVVLALNKAEAVFKGEIDYVGLGDVVGFFEAINKTDCEVSEMREELDEHHDALAVLKCSEDEEGNVILKMTGADYRNLTEDAKDVFAQLVLNAVNGAYANGKGLFTAENAEDFIKEAFIIAKYNAGGISDEAMAAAIYKFESVIGFDGEDEELYGAVKNRDTFAKVAKTIEEEVESIDELAEVIEQAASVQLVNETHWRNLVNVISKNNDIFGVSEAQIGKLKTDTSLGYKFCEKFQGTYYSVEEIAENWKKIYKEITKTDDGDDSSGPSGRPISNETETVTNLVNTQLVQDANNKDPNVIIKDYYTDMSDYYTWASDAVLNLTQANLLAGYGDKTFRPGNSVTRAEFMKMLVNVFGLGDMTATSAFTDVDKSAWYYIYVASAEKLGIAQGYGDGRFGVNDTITRQDALTLIYRAANAKGVSLNKFAGGLASLTDSNEIADYAKEAAAALYNAGIYLDGTNPKDIDKLEPKRNASRAYLAVILNQIYINLK